MQLPHRMLYEWKEQKVYKEMLSTFKKDYIFILYIVITLRFNVNQGEWKPQGT